MDFPFTHAFNQCFCSSDCSHIFRCAYDSAGCRGLSRYSAMHPDDWFMCVSLFLRELIFIFVSLPPVKPNGRTVAKKRRRCILVTRGSRKSCHWTVGRVTITLAIVVVVVVCEHVGACVHPTRLLNAPSSGYYLHLWLLVTPTVGKTLPRCK